MPPIPVTFFTLQEDVLSSNRFLSAPAHGIVTQDEAVAKRLSHPQVQVQHQMTGKAYDDHRHAAVRLQLFEESHLPTPVEITTNSPSVQTSKGLYISVEAHRLQVAKDRQVIRQMFDDAEQNMGRLQKENRRLSVQLADAQNAVAKMVQVRKHVQSKPAPPTPDALAAIMRIEAGLVLLEEKVKRDARRAVQDRTDGMAEPTDADVEAFVARWDEQLCHPHRSGPFWWLIDAFRPVLRALARTD